jgi:hypothetical protein
MIKKLLVQQNMMKTNLRLILMFGVFFPCSGSLFAQGEDKPQYVSQTFSHWQLINCQTTEVIPQKGYEFRIQHRFGAVQMNEDLYKQFLGMDLRTFVSHLPIQSRREHTLEWDGPKSGR